MSLTSEQCQPPTIAYLIAKASAVKRRPATMGSPVNIKAAAGPLGRLTDEEVSELWVSFDQHCSGRLSFAEIESGMRDKYPFLNDRHCTRAMALGYRAAAGADQFVEQSEFPQLLANVSFVSSPCNFD